MLQRINFRKLILIAIGVSVGFWLLAIRWAAVPVLQWPDRRPIGALFLASHAHVSAKNPRGWFNEPNLDVTGPGGHQRFCAALLSYADRSIPVLRSVNAQGLIVWDIEGEQYPHKTTYIGDPRLINQLAPETAGCIDEFFARFRLAGLRTGVTVRPQMLTFDRTNDNPLQRVVLDYASVLSGKIDYARRRWGTTLFYIDSNQVVLRPLEAFHLRNIAAARPDILLIPEYHYLPYYAFTAPYDDARRGARGTSGLIRALYPGAFKLLNISDTGSAERGLIEQAYRDGDILAFRGWFCGADCLLLQHLREKGLSRMLK